jgi:hypothetical protein
MINRTDNPVGWAMLLSDLDEAHEHLGNLIKKSGPIRSSVSPSCGYMWDTYTHTSIGHGVAGRSPRTSQTVSGMLQERFAMILSQSPNNSFKPNPLRGSV